MVDSRKAFIFLCLLVSLLFLTSSLGFGGETGWHLHHVPVYAYVLSGTLSVEMENGERYAFKEGDAIIEVVNTAHNGKNAGTVPVKLVVFYTGAEGSPTTVKAPRK